MKNGAIDVHGPPCTCGHWQNWHEGAHGACAHCQCEAFQARGRGRRTRIVAPAAGDAFAELRTAAKALARALRTAAEALACASEAEAFVRALDMPRPAPMPAPASANPTPVGNDLGIGEERVLIAIAQRMPTGITRRQLAPLIGGFKLSTRNRYLQRLVSRGFVADGATLTATPLALAYLGDDFEPLPTGSALRAHWLRELGDGQAAIFEAVCDAYPAPVQREELRQRTAFAHSTVNRYLQKLKAHGLVTSHGGGAVRAAPELFHEGEPTT